MYFEFTVYYSITQHGGFLLLELLSNEVRQPEPCYQQL